MCASPMLTETTSNETIVGVREQRLAHWQARLATSISLRQHMRTDFIVDHYGHIKDLLLENCAYRSSVPKYVMNTEVKE